MKDIDKLLKEQPAPAPRRALQHNFTDRVVDGITTPRNRSWRDYLQGAFSMKLLQRPTAVMAVIGTMIAISGSAYALTNWPAISTIITGQKDLASGNRIVKVEAENCDYTKSLSGSPNGKDAYYEIKKDSALSNQQVIDMVQGICEENVMNKILNEKMPSVTKANHAMRSSRLLKVTAINDGTMTFQSDPSYSHKQDNLTHPVAPDVKTFDYDMPVDKASITVGDTVSLITADSRNSSSNTEDYREDPATMSIVAIVKLKPLTGSPDTFYKSLGSDFVRVEATDNGTYKRVYEFNENRR